jgi:hypothetical protein
MELIVNQIFLTLLRIVGTLQNSDRASAPESAAETRAKEKRFLKMLQEKQALIRRIARLYCRNKEDQQDLFQEIVGHLWKGLPSYRGEASVSPFSFCLSLPYLTKPFCNCLPINSWKIFSRFTS